MDNAIVRELKRFKCYLFFKHITKILFMFLTNTIYYVQYTHMYYIISKTNTFILR